MIKTEAGWGAAPSHRYDDLVQRFRPLFEELRGGAVQREIERRPLDGEIQALKATGFLSLRVPDASGAPAVTLPELFALLIELSAADSNLTQSIRGHYGFLETLLPSSRSAHRARWLARISRGEMVGPARSEAGAAARAHFGTRLIPDTAGGWRLEGEKFYTTGCRYADWIDVSATGPDDRAWTVAVARHAPGVEVQDDWDGFGQALTASGGIRFHDVPVIEEPVPDDERFAYAQAFFQLFHLATLAGIGRAMSHELAQAVATRARSYTHGNGDRVSQDPQILQVVGSVRSAAYCAGAIVATASQALQRAFEMTLEGDEDAITAAVALVDLEVAQAQTVVSQLIIDAAGQCFDALGASAVLRTQGLDRFWRNARTLASHNPRVYKDRIVGDFAVNGTPHPGQWRVGVA